MPPVTQSDRGDGLTSLLAHHLEKDLLRLTTAGSVDDGKSTLIGRLLHDSKAVYEDQLASVRSSRFNRSGGPIDFALLTDGLRAEREQGITIDVAYRYFETPLRKFIIADTPGHEQYTRNMATGASTADLAVILVDATRGVLSQTRRHGYIASLLGIPNVVAAINKMDLLEYREDVFLNLHAEFLELARQLGIQSVVSIPISALAGDNVVNRTDQMPWYEGPTFLEHLETVPLRSGLIEDAMRFPVQYVLRPDANFRGFAGQVAGGTIRPGSPVLALPSRQQSHVRSIVTYDGEEPEAFAPMSVTLTLEDEIELSRGDMLVSPDEPPHISRHFEAMVVWFALEPLVLGRSYLIKHNVRASRAKATNIRFRVNMHTLEHEPARELKMNDVASVEFEAAGTLFFDPYTGNRATGSLILIDPLSNATVGAAMIQKDLAALPEPLAESANRWALLQAPVTAEDRYARHGHSPALILLQDRPRLAVYLERALFAHGFEVQHASAAEIPADHLRSLLKFARSAGLVLILSSESSRQGEIQSQTMAAEEGFDFVFDLAKQDLPPDDTDAVMAVFSLVGPLRRSLQ
jgi:bifunctional enzyme CysN/CysC/sulfate adenylyltransferase subunit 1